MSNDVFVGLDWAVHTHAVCIIDAAGTVLDRFEVTHDRVGLAELMRRLARRGARLRIAIERPSGLIVDALVEAGHGRHRQQRGFGAHWTTFRPMKVSGMSRCRVVHGGGRSALATNRATAAVGNPWSARCGCSAANLTPRCIGTQGVHRLPCPCGDCPARLPRQGPNETRSLQGAGRPRRAPRCSARPSKLERRFMSFPPRLPTRVVIPQLPGVCL